MIYESAWDVYWELGAHKVRSSTAIRTSKHGSVWQGREEVILASTMLTA